MVLNVERNDNKGVKEQQLTFRFMASKSVCEKCRDRGAGLSAEGVSKPRHYARSTARSELSPSIFKPYVET